MTQRLIHPMSLRSTQFDLPAVANGYLLLAVLDQAVAFDVVTLSEAWRHQMVSAENQSVKILAGPIELDDKVYALLSNADLVSLDLKTGKELGAWHGQSIVNRQGSGTPLRPGLAMGDGMLFATFGTKELCAFGSKP